MKKNLTKQLTTPENYHNEQEGNIHQIN